MSLMLLGCTFDVAVGGDCSFVAVTEVRAAKPYVETPGTAFTGKEDYVELHNFGDEDIDLTDWSLSNVPDWPDAPFIPAEWDCVVPAGGSQVFLAAQYAAEEAPRCGPEQAPPLYFDFNKDGDTLYVWMRGAKACGTQTVVIPDQHEGFVWQRDPDDPTRWCHAEASPGADNGPCLCEVYGAC